MDQYNPKDDKLEGSQRLPCRAAIVIRRQGIAQRGVGDEHSFGIGDQGMQFHAAPWVQDVWWIIALIGVGGKEEFGRIGA
jgi:hypothetical protein